MHKTVFPQDFLADFGFEVVRVPAGWGCRGSSSAGLQPVAEGKRDKVLRVVKDAFGVPEPFPAPRQP